MDSKLSSFLSNLYLNGVEKSIIPKYEKNLDILFYGRYVDDCILIIKKDSYQKILQKFNTYAEKLQFKNLELYQTPKFFQNHRLFISKLPHIHKN